MQAGACLLRSWFIFPGDCWSTVIFPVDPKHMARPDDLTGQDPSTITLIFPMFGVLLIT